MATGMTDLPPRAENMLERRRMLGSPKGTARSDLAAIDSPFTTTIDVACAGLMDEVTGMVEALPASPPAVEVAAVGNDERSVEVGGIVLKVFTYRPGGCDVSGLLVVFHGVGRNADGYRHHARPLADRLCLVVASPLFDEKRFPSWRYQRGGIVDHDRPQPPATWTVTLVAPLVASLQQIEGTVGKPYYLIGHSAGAQFLSRVAAYSPSTATRIVIANPSTYVLASPDEAVPYGFRGMQGSGDLLRAYLARPVTLLLGEEDFGSENLAESAEAVRQGGTRIDRGRRTFAAAQAYAVSHGWTFGWRIVEVPGVGHSAGSMFSGDQAVHALSDAGQ